MKLLKSKVKYILFFIIVLAQNNANKLFAQHEWQQDMLQRINDIRQNGCKCGTKYYPPAPLLTWNPQLEQSATLHAADMNHKKYFSHYSKNGKGFSARIQEAKYDWTFVGENIATGQTSVQEVMEDWIKSPTHCKNMMNPNYQEVGAGKESTYWVQDFGAPMRSAKTIKRKKK